jgi:very-short-patch-repair endonuclease
MYALKRAIENYFQVEPNEIGATIMGESDTPNILIYEAAEGSLGVLSQIVDQPLVYKALMQEAFNLCFIKNGREIPAEELVPATYDDLLSYYNQMHHQVINRNYIRAALRMLKEATVEVLTSKSFNSYDEQHQALQAARDPNSITEDKFLKYLYAKGLKLPDEAQPKIVNMYVRPDFFYKPNICIFCDGTPHDENQIHDDDTAKRKALTDAGYQVLVWHYKDSLDEFVSKRPDIFKPVK